MKKTFLLLFLLSFALVLEAFAIGAFDVNAGVLSSSGTPEYMVGVTIKSIGTLGLELNVEGSLGSTFDVGKIGNIKKWNLSPTLFVSLPTGEIRPYAGVGINTTYDISTWQFGAVDLSTLYYRVGVDAFLKAFSLFGEFQGKMYYQPHLIVNGISEWRVGAGLAF